MPKILEVIAASVADAVAAEAGGADRIELVRDLAVGGLTPPLDLVREVIAAVQIPVRVIVRENDTDEVASVEEWRRLQDSVRALAEMGVDGLVIGFRQGNEIDLEHTAALAATAPQLRYTCNRVIERVTDWERALHGLEAIPQLDRVLSNGGAGTWPERAAHLERLQQNTRLTLLFGGGMEMEGVTAFAQSSVLREIHVGRLARRPLESAAPVHSEEVQRLKEFIRG